MRIKRILAAAAAAAMLATCTACSADSGKIKIGISKMMTHDAMDRAENGFIDALNANGYDDTKVEIDAQNGQGETSNLNTIATQFVGDNVDLIFAIATPAAQAAQGQTTEIPIIGTAITDFADAGLVNSNDNPGTNVSGTTDMNPVKEQIDLMLKLVPETKTVGFLYNSSEDNSVLQVGIAKEYVESLGLQWTEKTVSNTNEVQQATTSIVTECDAIYIPTDNIFASSMTTVYEVAVEAKKPVICGESGMVMSGGLATLGLDYYDLGYQAGLMAIRVLEGEDISKMPIEGASEFVYCINGDFAEAIGLTIPEDLQQYVTKAE
ncbi:MAG: ABC transporter substrate-binding protein [Oscillospiraceae bacterium]|nr:ABC transporter substrate-binding protein [Oscillospiraceae bacterium]